MGERFNEELKKISEIKTYSKRKQRLLDDLATAYIQHDTPLDKALVSVKSLKKALRVNGYNDAQIEDYLIEFSYISKTQIRKLYTESIYNEDCTIRKEIECIPSFHTEKSLTDLIIEEIQSRPKLLNALKKGTSEANIRQNYNIANSTLLINFYNANKDIIELD